jgi:hypothetical protein
MAVEWEGPRMAEYVRRRRPPASHPYWARLHDRAHPPPVIAPVVIPTGIGLALGLYGGLRPTFSTTDAVKLAATVAGGLAAIIFVLSLPLLLYDASRQAPRRERWVMSVLGAMAVAAVLFMVGLFGLTPMLVVYSWCSGEGPWLGMLIGGLIGGVPGAAYAAETRRQWRARQRRWPRWESMRARRTTPALTTTPIPVPADPPPITPETEMNEPRPVGDPAGPA